MRARDYTRLDAAGHVYLDYAGGALYAESQLARHRDLLAGAVFGNPHSQNVPSQDMTAQVEATRAQILEFFRASPEEYEVIFTPNATGALRLVGESYPFGPGGRYLLTFDNHNSVNGIRQFARAKGASVSYVPLDLPDLRVSPQALARQLQAATPVRRRLARRRPGPAPGDLFAFPAQSNFSGVQHPLTWIAQAQDAGYDVLLDAAAFAPACRLDLSRWHPDYVSLSFYKIFGYPTGIGALLARLAGAGQAPPPVVRRWHHHLLLGPRPGGPRRGLLPDPGTGRLRRRHRRLPGHPRRRHRPGPHQLGRYRDHPHQGHLPDRLAAGRTRRPAAQHRRARRAHLRPGRNLRRRLPVPGFRRRLPRHPLPRARDLSCPTPGTGGFRQAPYSNSDQSPAAFTDGFALPEREPRLVKRRCSRAQRQNRQFCTRLSTANPPWTRSA